MSRRPRKRGYPRHERTVPELAMPEGARLVGNGWVSAQTWRALLDGDLTHKAAVLKATATEVVRAQTASLYAAARAQGYAVAFSTARSRHQECRRRKREEQRTTTTPA